MKSAMKQDIYVEINSYKGDIFDEINKLRDFILEEDCPSLVVDIANLSIFDATKVCVVSSTYHFAKYPEGNILWFVAEAEARQVISSLKLKNIRTEIKIKTDKTIEYFDKKYKASFR